MSAEPAPQAELDIFRTGGLYSVSESARLAGTELAIARRWLNYYDECESQPPPRCAAPRNGSDEGVRTLSFLQFVELTVATRFRHEKLPLKRIWDARMYAEAELATPYPFASLSFKDLGGAVLQLLLDVHPGLALPTNGRERLPETVAAELDNFDYAEDSFASIWHPYGREFPVVVDPRVVSGTLTIEGTRITVGTIRARHRVGETAEFIAQEYSFLPVDVERILRHAA